MKAHERIADDEQRIQPEPDLPAERRCHHLRADASFFHQELAGQAPGQLQHAPRQLSERVVAHEALTLQDVAETRHPELGLDAAHETALPVDTVTPARRGSLGLDQLERSRRPLAMKSPEQVTEGGETESPR